VTLVPEQVKELAERRVQARAERDFATADAIRDQLAEQGWLVRDVSGGYELTPRPPYPVHPDLPALTRAVERPVGAARRATVGLLAEGWPDDLRRCVQALVAQAPADVVVSVLDLGNVDGAGDVLHELATAHPERIEELHVAVPTVGWGPARAALLAHDPAEVHIVMDCSTVLDGDAISPLLDALVDASVAAAGWRGANFDLDDGWRSVADAGPGEVDVLLGYLMAVRRSALTAGAGPDPKARYYRNADLELSLILRERGGRLVVPVPPDQLPCHQERHHGYHDVDPGYRERESRRNYDRLLRRFRGRTELLAPRGSGGGDA
jgi:Glycosyl transferase family 2